MTEDARSTDACAPEPPDSGEGAGERLSTGRQAGGSVQDPRRTMVVLAVMSVFAVAGLVGTWWFAGRVDGYREDARQADEREAEAREELRLLRDSEAAFRQLAAAQLMREAHFRTTLRDLELTGHIRKGPRKFPVALFRRGNDIQIQHYRPGDSGWRAFHVKHGEVDSRQLDFFEMIDGKMVRFPDERLGDAVEGTDVTYEDLAMPFLYWPDVTFHGSEEVKGQDCWVVRAENPGTAGNYALVKACIHKKTHGLMQVVGYNREGKALKRIQVMDAMGVRNAQQVPARLPWESIVIRTARFDSFDPVTGKTVGITYLEFDRPKREPKAPAGPPAAGP